MEQAFDGLTPMLRTAHAAGRAAHRSIALDLEPFTSHLESIAASQEGGVAAVRQAAEEYPADLFLASACELDCPGAWDRWTDLFAEPLRAYARRRGASDSDADDVVASLPGDLLQPPANGRFATHMGAYKGSGSLFAWLGRIVDRRLADRARRRRAEEACQDDRDSSAESGPSETIIRTETAERVARAFEGALRQLSPREFELLVLRYRDAVPQKEIAERERVTPARISFLLKRIQARVRNYVLAEIPDETSAHWLGRDGLAKTLKDVIAHILEKER